MARLSLGRPVRVGTWVSGGPQRSLRPAVSTVATQWSACRGGLPGGGQWTLCARRRGTTRGAGGGRPADGAEVRRVTAGIVPTPNGGPL